ncbi:DUF1080 domain-containing protein [Draconibacterium sp.]|nr:DUF1080 domain-containing protein [Draconibacterium sp.]
MKKINSNFGFFALIFFTVLISCNNSNKKDDYTILYNGSDLTDWTTMCRGDDPELPKMVFTPGENGELHVFKDIPDSTGLGEGKNETHGMIFTKKSFSRYSFRFEYKWGEKVYNNFDKYNYDAGIYYHIFEEKLWPRGIEYQIRYDHTKGINHTGDIWNSGSSFDWVAGSDNTYLPIEWGGVQQERKSGEHRCLADAKFNALNDQWNQCEIIVMGDKYAIHKLNGDVVNVITNLAQKKGTIGLQAETAEIFYRNVKIKEFAENIPIERFLK